MNSEFPLIEKLELVKEIHYLFQNERPKIIGRIYKIILGANAKYQWDINFYCRLDHEVSVYIPGSHFGDSLGETENKLSEYVKRFEAAREYQKNDLF